MFPEPFPKYFDREAEIFSLSQNQYEDNEHIRAHIDLLNLNIQFGASLIRQSNEENLEEVVLRKFAIRGGNEAFGALSLATRGHYQASIAICRGMIENGFLLALFVNEPELILKWDQVTDVKERKVLFDPIKVRLRLEEFDLRQGQNKNRRAEWYKLFSTMGTHFSPDSLSLSLVDKKLVPGPFFAVDRLRICLHETTRWFHYQNIQLLNLFGTERFSGEFLDKYLLVATGWFRKYR